MAGRKKRSRPYRKIKYAKQAERTAGNKKKTIAKDKKRIERLKARTKGKI